LSLGIQHLHQGGLVQFRQLQVFLFTQGLFDQIPVLVRDTMVIQPGPGFLAGLSIADTIK